MIDKLVKLLGGGIIEGANSITKTIFGSKEARDTQAHDEQMSVMQAFAAEFLPRENRTWWDSFVDGLNRLPRPVMTFGVIALFWYCVEEPAEFAASMTALKLMPAEGWGIMATIVVFWFGGKFLEKSWGQKIEFPSADQMKAMLEVRKELLAQAPPPQPDLFNPGPITWNKPRNEKAPDQS